ncbi:MAG: hypothetical protein HOK25_06730 [Rhodospirillaceae bacterium]|nr:hypothetical protein [Rhodospirillaceae bacterium]
MLFEYLYLGPLSFVYLDDEAELTLSYLVFGNRPDTGTQFTHQLASGVDKNASFVVGGEILSLNRLFVEIFPLWIGILVHKLIVYGVGLGGTYLLCRRGLNCDRFVSISLAALFTISHFRLLQVTFDNGMSWALLPLAAYIVVLGTER